MRKVCLILVVILFFSCKTKTVTVEKTKETNKESLSRHFDSLFQTALKHQLEWQKKQSSVTEKLKLTSIAELDSLGNRNPFHFKHYVDGKLKEEIFLQGGEINKETTSNKSDEFEKKNENKKEKIKINVDVGEKKATEKATLDKNKKAETTGFQFGFYVWLFMIIIMLIVLYWISKKLKLPDKIKALLGSKGG